MLSFLCMEVNKMSEDLLKRYMVMSGDEKKKCTAAKRNQESVALLSSELGSSSTVSPLYICKCLRM